MDKSLSVIERLIEHGYPKFGIFKKVQQINYLDYHSYLVTGKSVGQFRKRMKANQFVFVYMIVPKLDQQPSYRICFAIGTIKWATTAFCYIFNDENQQCFTVEALQPLLHHCQFNQSAYQDDIQFSHPKLTIEMMFHTHKLSVKIDNALFHISADLPRLSEDSHQPLAICTPTGKSGWTYTQKEPFAKVSGQLTFKSSCQDFTIPNNSTIHFSQAIASLDWSLGYMRRMTNWFWSSVNHMLDDGRQFTMNLAMGVNETGFCENACWIDGRIYYLPPVMFNRPTDKKQDWQIYTPNLGWSKVSLQLTFTPIRCYQKNDRFYLVDSIFEQWLGFYQGTIYLENETIALKKVIGLAEDHYAKW